LEGAKRRLKSGEKKTDWGKYSTKTQKMVQGIISFFGSSVEKGLGGRRKRGELYGGGWANALHHFGMAKLRGNLEQKRSTVLRLILLLCIRDGDRGGNYGSSHE